MPEEKITLDREAFRSLASDTRISILKSLDQRRKMLTELSKQLDMSPSTVKEHMDSLKKAGLVVLKDDGHKWKYYELTRKGRGVLHPEYTRIWIILSLSGLAILVTAYDMITGFAGQVVSPLMKSGGEEVLTEMTTPAAAPATLAQLPYIHIIGLVAFSMVFAAALGFYLGTRKKPGPLAW